jgi:hypothetical protein
VKKFLLMSVLIGTFWIPLTLARMDMRRGTKLVRKRFLVFCIVYVLTVLYIMPRL